MNKQQLVTTGGIGLALYLIAAGLSFALFSFLLPGSVAKGLPNALDPATYPDGGFAIDPNAPKTEECPLNGQLFTEQERDIWETRRPLAVMIENHVESRPQSGLSSADIVYEAVAEGGITRFMGMYYCGAAAKSLAFAPVRSARTYYVTWVSEYDALYNHVGGAGLCNDPTVDERAKALCQIQEYGIKDMDQFSISFPTCYRDETRLGRPVATEHTMVCDSNKLYKLAAERGWTNVDAKGVSWDEDFEPWVFKDDASQLGSVSETSFVHWSGYEADFGIRWVHDPVSNTYERYMGGEPHIDLDTDESLRAKVVIAHFSDEIGPVDQHAHLLYDLVGTGTGIVFQDGEAIEVTWRKPTRTARTKYFVGNDELELNRGQIWIEVLPTGTDVEY